jgi:small nuclear ribonucleoprotein (snRNP)-like protein
MNIDNMTIGEFKELKNLFATKEEANTNSLVKKYIGKYVIVRSRNEGINAGVVVDADETGIVLKDARRIWYHKPADESLSWYEGVAVSGLHKDSKISNEVDEKIIIEDYSIILVSDKAEKSIRGFKTNAQN